MKRLVLTLAALGLVGSLAACAKKEATTEAAAAPPAPAPAASPAAPAEAKMAKGTGTVTAVGADSVTIDHAPIPEVGWPAMTMGFKASPEIAEQVKAGDKVAFDLKVLNGGGEITAIEKR